MKRGVTKEEIIHATQELIARNGIRAVRVDEIAQTLGISKRTLYEMFTDKNDLVSACLEAMSHQQRERIVACRKRRGGNPLQKVLRLTNEYIDNLYTVDHRFLSDISRKIIFAEHYDEHREFWRRELTDYLETCRQEQLLLPEIDAPAFAEQLMSTILDLRLNGTVREELRLFCRTILRGAGTRKGIELLRRKSGRTDRFFCARKRHDRRTPQRRLRPPEARRPLRSEAAVPAEFQSLRSPGLRKPRTARPSSIPAQPSVRRHLPDAKEAANRSQPLPITGRFLNRSCRHRRSPDTTPRAPRRWTRPMP